MGSEASKTVLSITEKSQVPDENSEDGLPPNTFKGWDREEMKILKAQAKKGGIAGIAALKMIKEIRKESGELHQKRIRVSFIDIESTSDGKIIEVSA